MGTFFYKLHGVPFDEAIEIRRLLDEADIAYYETTAGNWGVSLAALWLVDKKDLVPAKALLNQFQLQWQEQQQVHQPDSFLQRVQQQPLKFILALAAVLAILYLSIAPFTGAWS